MIRFFALALPTLLLLQGLAHVLWGTLRWAPDTALPASFMLGSWVLESTGLILLFLLLTARAGNRWLAGIAAAWSAWLFRGPLVVLTLVGVTSQAHEPWWRLSLGWLAVYTVSGLVLAMLLRRSVRPGRRTAQRESSASAVGRSASEGPSADAWTAEP